MSHGSLGLALPAICEKAERKNPSRAIPSRIDASQFQSRETGEGLIQINFLPVREG